MRHAVHGGTAIHPSPQRRRLVHHRHNPATAPAQNAGIYAANACGAETRPSHRNEEYVLVDEPRQVDRPSDQTPTRMRVFRTFITFASRTPVTLRRWCAMLA